MIGLVGDVHANTDWLKDVLDLFHRHDVFTVMQVGDLGVGMTSERDWDDVQIQLYENGQTIYAVPGNHENYDIIDRLRPDESGWLPYRPGIFLAPRGHRWEYDKRTFVALGGAGSVDRHFRINRQTPENRLWWPQEALTDIDVAKVVHAGHADIMVAHDAPQGVGQIETRLRHTSGLFRPWDLEYAEESRQRLTFAFRKVRPKFFIHGHFHFPVRDTFEDTEIVGLDQDNAEYGSVGTLQVQPDIHVELWDTGYDSNGHLQRIE